MSQHSIKTLIPINFLKEKDAHQQFFDCCFDKCSVELEYGINYFDIPIKICVKIFLT